ncbi:MAG: hypothetical protein JWM78_1307 [Verrucomicrobiaceae bacterium]|nr:hypothetical protein [Verrucomicrobiaceae bacterium]
MIDLAKFTTESGSQMMWGAYLASAVVICFVVFMLTRRWQADIRWLLLTLLAVFLFIPAPVPGRAPLRAPAMIFVVLSPMTGTPEVLAPILVRLTLGAIVAILIVIIAGIVRRWRRRKAAAQ